MRKAFDVKHHPQDFILLLNRLWSIHTLGRQCCDWKAMSIMLELCFLEVGDASACIHVHSRHYATRKADEAEMSYNPAQQTLPVFCVRKATKYQVR